MINKAFRTLLFVIRSMYLVPNLFLFYFVKNADLYSDIERWKNIKKELSLYNNSYNLLYLLKNYKEFRNIFYYRYKNSNIPVKLFLVINKILCPPLNSLLISCDIIGKGIYIQHGISTIIAAKSIGSNCWISQQVTIGYDDNNDSPVLGDNVRIAPGAQIIGGIKIGNNVVIGPNALIVRSIPDNSTVVAPPSYIVKKNGNFILEKLDNI